MKIFEQLINLLVMGAIVLTVVKTYLTANKVWSRKHERVVAESVSVSAQLIGIVTSVPFLVKYTFIDTDLMSFANMSIKLALTLFFLAIGIGVWVRVEGRESLWAKVKRSLKLEKEESLDLIIALIRPAGAGYILEALKKLAVIDKDLDEREMEFIQGFADNWGIRIDFRSEFEAASVRPTEDLHIELRNTISKYLSITPDKGQASQFLDIINRLVELDHQVDAREQFILDEIRGMIEGYVHDDEQKTLYNVIVVPQDGEERATVSTLLPNVKPRDEWGGNVYFAGRFHSRPYAEMISEKYQNLNLFSTVKALRE